MAIAIQWGIGWQNDSSDELPRFENTSTPSRADWGDPGETISFSAGILNNLPSGITITSLTKQVHTIAGPATASGGPVAHPFTQAGFTISATNEMASYTAQLSDGSTLTWCAPGFDRTAIEIAFEAPTEDGFNDGFSDGFN